MQWHPTLARLLLYIEMPPSSSSKSLLINYQTISKPSTRLLFIILTNCIMPPIFIAFFLTDSKETLPLHCHSSGHFRPGQPAKEIKPELLLYGFAAWETGTVLSPSPVQQPIFLHCQSTFSFPLPSKFHASQTGRTRPLNRTYAHNTIEFRLITPTDNDVMCLDSQPGRFNDVTGDTGDIDANGLSMNISFMPAPNN